MRNSIVMRAGAVSLAAAVVIGCAKRARAPRSPADGDSGPAPAQPGAAAPGGKKYYPHLTKKQAEPIFDDQTRTEAQVVAILGEPSERGPTRHFNNRHGHFTEYKLTWLRAEGRPAVEITFLNGTKETVQYGGQ
jgi:hypothetical protein